MAHLRERARALGCGKLVLDTPLSNALGHRFYFRCGCWQVRYALTSRFRTEPERRRDEIDYRTDFAPVFVPFLVPQIKKDLSIKPSP